MILIWRGEAGKISFSHILSYTFRFAKIFSPPTFHQLFPLVKCRRVVLFLNYHHIIREILLFERFQNYFYFFRMVGDPDRPSPSRSLLSAASMIRQQSDTSGKINLNFYSLMQISGVRRLVRAIAIEDDRPQTSMQVMFFFFNLKPSAVAHNNYVHWCGPLDF